MTLDRTHTLTSFAAYADWAKCLHFGIRNGQVGSLCATLCVGAI